MCRLLILFLTFFITTSLPGQDWNEIRNSGKGKLNLYWYTSVPFIQASNSGQLIGIEYEILSLFKDYLQERYKVELELNWIEAESFVGIIEQIKNSRSANQMGVSAFSVTEERKEFLQFTNSYFPDIAVLVSSQGTPIVERREEIVEMMKTMEAVTIKGTTYEVLLNNLKSDLDLDFPTLYIESDQNVLDFISKTSNRFGFIDLPIYLMLIKNGGDLTRQNYFTHRGLGYGYILPPGSDWHVPFNEFLTNPDSKHAIAKVLSKYLGEELFEFLDKIYQDPQLSTSILTKEKELQLALIRNANLKLQEEQSFKRILIMGIGVSIVFLLVIGGLFYNNYKTTQVLLSQKKQIENQQTDIRQKNDQLLTRNSQLLALNEEKNNLVRILAHDLRSPLSRIIGMSDLVRRDQKDEPGEMITQIHDDAVQVNDLIGKILDVDMMEGNRVFVLKERVVIDQLVDEIVRRYQPVAEMKNIKFRIEVKQPNLSVQTDHLLLFQILENLVSNAMKFSPPSTTVELSVEDRDTYMSFKVADQGPGFSEKDKSLMFTRFQKLSAKPTGDETSTGLGLSIVKRYVGDLGGTIQVHSEFGKGSEFTINIPHT